MSQDTFPGATPAGAFPPDDSTRIDNRTIYTSSENKEVLHQVFQIAIDNGYDFIYRPSKPAKTPRKLMFVSDGIEANHVLRLLIDEQEVHEIG